jgi:hypothetical protein
MGKQLRREIGDYLMSPGHRLNSTSGHDARDGGSGIIPDSMSA